MLKNLLNHIYPKYADLDQNILGASLNESRARFLGNDTEIYIFIIGLFLILFSFSTCIILIYSLLKHHTGHRMANYPTVISALFYFLSSVLFVFAFSYFNEHDNNNLENDDTFVICTVLFVISLASAKLSVHSQFFGRLYSSFKGSYLALNTKTIYTAIILLCLLLIASIWWIILIFLRYIALNHLFNSYYPQIYPVFVFIFLFDFSLSWFVVGLFINKLFKTILFRSRTNFFEKTTRDLNAPNAVDKEKSEASTQNIETPTHKPQESSHIRVTSLMIDVAYNSMNEEDKARLDLITRQFILSSLSIVTAQICYVSFIVVFVMQRLRGTTLDQNVLFLIYGGIFYPMEVVFNCIALYLNYSFASKYYGFCCKCCHSACSLYVFRKASNKIVSTHTRELSEINVSKDLHLSE